MKDRITITRRYGCSRIGPQHTWVKVCSGVQFNLLNQFICHSCAEYYVRVIITKIARCGDFDDIEVQPTLSTTIPSCFFQSRLSTVAICHLLTYSCHLFGGRSCGRFLFYGYHSETQDVRRCGRQWCNGLWRLSLAGTIVVRALMVKPIHL